MKIKVERPKCISCGSCAAVCPEFFEMEENGMAHLKNSKKDADGNEELQIQEPGCAKDASEVCPVQIIKTSD
jgi:ferredoxin